MDIVRDCSRCPIVSVLCFYAHKASFMTSQQVPLFPPTVVAHRVLKSWTESQATNTKRFSNVHWNHKLLGLGSDALAYPTNNGVGVIQHVGVSRLSTSQVPYVTGLDWTASPITVCLYGQRTRMLEDEIFGFPATLTGTETDTLTSRCFVSPVGKKKGKIGLNGEAPAAIQTYIYRQHSFPV